MAVTKKSFLPLCLSLSLLFSLFAAVLARPAEAKTVRAAIVVSLSGDVTIKKGGGSKVYDVYANMSLNQGDTLYTGANSSATLNLSNGDAEVTVGDNAELNVSDLNTTNGDKKSKLKMWAGSMWVKVKTLAGLDDEFEVETPTAVMGVRGTHFYVGADAATGRVKMVVGSGKVSATTVITNAGGDQFTNVTYLQPTQQITLDSRSEVNDISLKVDFLDVPELVQEASPEVIEAMIKDKAEMDKENDEWIDSTRQELVNGGSADTSNSLVVNDISELEKVILNFYNLIGNIAKEALESNKISQSEMNKLIDEANSKILDLTRKLDLDQVQPLDKKAGFDPEADKKKQGMLIDLEAKNTIKKDSRSKLLDQIRERLGTILRAAEEARNKLNEANQKVASEVKEQAEKAFQQQQDVNEQKGSTPPSTPTGNEGGSGGDDGGGQQPTPAPTPTPTPKVTLSSDAQEATGPFNISVHMSDFNGDNDIFAVELHLTYDGSVYYANGNAGNLASDIFTDANTSAYSAKEYPSDSPTATQRELVYAITRFGDGANNVSVTGDKKLTTLPFQGFNLSTEKTVAFKISSMTVIRKNRAEVQEIQIPVSTMNEVQVKIKPGLAVPQRP